MKARAWLGEFELMVLLAVVFLGDDAYGVPIARELQQRRGRSSVSLGSIYAALERLEEKGLVRSTVGEPTPERGGRARRYFHLTRQGARAIRDTREVLTGFWRQIPNLEGGEKA
jgi:PadR family transcriptional regulator, regulatory protein PadR